MRSHRSRFPRNPHREEEDSIWATYLRRRRAGTRVAASYTCLKSSFGIFKDLTTRGKRLKAGFGVEDGRTRNLEEVGREFNVTGSASAKSRRRPEKLRHTSRS
jgi:RNA polymerase primary sigma factor